MGYVCWVGCGMMIDVWEVCGHGMSKDWLIVFVGLYCYLCVEDG